MGWWLFPSCPADDGALTVRYQLVARDILASCAYALCLFTDAARPFFSELYRCKLETCARFFFEYRSSERGKPTRTHCSPECRQTARRAEILKSVRRNRAEVKRKQLGGTQMKAALYARFSTDKQSEASIDDQHRVSRTHRGSTWLCRDGSLLGPRNQSAALHEPAGISSSCLQLRAARVRHHRRRRHFATLAQSRRAVPSPRRTFRLGHGGSHSRLGYASGVRRHHGSGRRRDGRTIST